MSPVVEQAVQARVVASSPSLETVPATLLYDRTDPFTVRMVFPPLATLEGTEVVWEFSRELLASGLSAPAGEGDVRVRPFGYGRTVVEFHAPEGTAMVHLRSADLVRFLDRSRSVVPEGREHLYLDLDSALAELLRDAR
ncbi:SsgA family sporulation/cell division regulator [Streptomyces sp. NPDC047002]|uniref:SsgA family sporulation/cell division regulator n=1 Tax=Streptomyces sp. NPDC047002 TaxID=3155475 RepID=UPI00345203CA